MKRHLLADAIILLCSLALAWAIVHYGLVVWLLEWLGGSTLLASFVGGLFFTSIVTTAPAIAVLGELSLRGGIVLTALVGGVGAMAGDYLLFMFVRDRVSSDVAYLFERTRTPKFFKLFHRKSFRRVLPFVGGLIIASPLPDELGLALLGASKLSTRSFLLLSYVMNTAGILLIGLAAHAA